MSKVYVIINEQHSLFPNKRKSYGYGTQVLVFHNDKRQKRELPNGKIISVVAETGWQLV